MAAFGGFRANRSLKGSTRPWVSTAAACRAARSSASRLRGRSCATRPVLILDEATSALDSENEEKIKGRSDRFDEGSHDVYGCAPLLDDRARHADRRDGRRRRSGNGHARGASRDKTAFSPSSRGSRHSRSAKGRLFGCTDAGKTATEVSRHEDLRDDWILT